ncbi:MAG: dTDP-4-dehydrorhamnose 3,5-epimerase [Caulobacterales bacterium]|nr:dTDP-4-dehydrorhamnose 3,5-epimerase [Caulobacterales bacterium]
MQVIDLEIPGCKLVGPPPRFGDARGWFSEHWSRRTFDAAGLSHAPVQDNLAWSEKAGTVRGLHFQAPPSAQAKLVSVLRGAILDVVVDIRHGSPTFGHHVRAELTAENGLMMLAPRGTAHGLVTLSDDTLVMYKVDDFFDPQNDHALRWNDPALGIDWPDGAGVNVKDKDAEAPLFADLPAYFEWGGA